MLLILGYKGTGKRAIPEVIYAGNDGRASREAIAARLDESWARMEKLRNPRGSKIPFRTLRTLHQIPPGRAGLFIPPTPAPPPPPPLTTPEPAPLPPARQTNPPDPETILAAAGSKGPKPIKRLTPPAKAAKGPNKPNQRK